MGINRLALAQGFPIGRNHETGFSRGFRNQVLVVVASMAINEEMVSGDRRNMMVHRDLETGLLLNSVVVWADEGTKMKVDVSIVFKGEDVCPGLNKGDPLYFTCGNHSGL